MDFDLKLQFFATTTFLGGGSLIVTLYNLLESLGYKTHNIIRALLKMYKTLETNIAVLYRSYYNT